MKMNPHKNKKKKKYEMTLPWIFWVLIAIVGLCFLACVIQWCLRHCLKGSPESMKEVGGSVAQGGANLMG